MSELSLEGALSWAIAASFWAVFLIAVHLSLRFVITYAVGSDAIEVIAFRALTLSRVRFEEIAGVEVVPFGDLLKRSLRSSLFWAARAGNRIYSREGVVITRRGGKGRALVITPDHPGSFAEDLRRRCGLEGPGGAATGVSADPPPARADRPAPGPSIR